MDGQCDYIAALEELDELDPQYYEHGETIRHALKLAAIVTGEPSEWMLRKGNDAPDEGLHSCHEIFKAMIAEAQRQVEGV